MASKVRVILVDDTDGGEADETVSFSLDGTDYQIDLSKVHATELREALETWIPAARRVGGRRPKRPSQPTFGSQSAPGTKAPKADTSAVRSWAREAGYQISDRGRIASGVVAAYEAAKAAEAEAATPTRAAAARTPRGRRATARV